MPPTTKRLSGSSTTSHASRRYSLPNTINSSTKVTKEKAEKVMARRRSRRQAGKEKENSNGLLQSPTPYWKVMKARGGTMTPPQTRSAKKLKKNNTLLVALSPSSTNDGPAVMLFSPPDQKENSRREKEELEISENERAKRVQISRESGNLLIFSPTHRSPAPLPVGMDEQHVNEDVTERSIVGTEQTLDIGMAEDMPASQKVESPPEAKEDISSLTSMEVDVPPQGCDKSQISHVTNQTSVNNEQITFELKSLREKVDHLVRSSKKSESRSEQELDTQRIQTEVLTVTNSKLEEKNQRLEYDFKELGSKYASEREWFIAETERLKSEIEGCSREANSRVAVLEMAKSRLENHLCSLQDQEQALKNTITELERDNAEATQKLEDSNRMLKALREEAGEEKERIEAETEMLNEKNCSMQRELTELTRKNRNLEQAIAQMEEKIYVFEKQLLPESKEQLATALKDLEQQKAVDEEMKVTIQKYECELQSLKNGFKNLQTEQAKERADFQALNEGSSQAYASMTDEIANKNILIAELEQHLETTQEQLTHKSKKVEEIAEDMKSLKSSMVKKASDLQESLEDAFSKLEQCAEEKQKLKKYLEEATEQLRKASEIKEQTLSKCNQRDVAMKAMENHEKMLQQRIKQLEKDLQSTKSERDEAIKYTETFNDREEELYVRLRESQKVRRDLHNRVMQLSGNIRVYVRVRPVIPCESEKSVEGSQNVSTAGQKKRKHEEFESESLFRYPGMGGSSCKKSALGADDPTKNLLEVTEPRKDRGGLSERRKKWTFGFDNIFNPSHGQEDVWEATEPLVQSAIDGYNVTIFAYGQTGSGKTFTMLGEEGNEGVVSRSVRKLFNAKSELEDLSRGESSVEISLELLEIYNEKVRDLLVENGGPDGQELPLKIKANEAVGSVKLRVSNEVEVTRVLATAQKRRNVKATASNAMSSRSHMIFTVHFSVTTKSGMQRQGKLNVCDLAGSERLGKSNANQHVGGALLKETQHINKSLSTLSNVIEKLQTGDANVPFRESKLTYLLQNSLVGNSKTLAIICCNPLTSHFHESLCSLRFAAKVNKVDLKAVANFSC